MKTESDIPRLEGSPFAPTEVVNGQDLSAEDHSFLQKREKIIEAGRKTFLEVGGALIDIHDYRSGLLYKRHGSFDAYCKQRWDLGRAHAYRLMEAAEIYAGMSPRGDITEGKTIMPTTEKQLRPLKKLPPKLRLEAWKNAVTAAGPKPVAARHVETEVRKLMTEEGNKPAAKSNKTGPLFHRLAEGDAEKIRALLAKIRKSVASGVVKRIPDWLDEVNALLPGS